MAVSKTSFDCPVCGKRVTRTRNESPHFGDGPDRFHHAGRPAWLDWVDEADGEGRPRFLDRMLATWHPAP